MIVNSLALQGNPVMALANDTNVVAFILEIENQTGQADTVTQLDFSNIGMTANLDKATLWKDNNMNNLLDVGS